MLLLLMNKKLKNHILLYKKKRLMMFVGGCFAIIISALSEFLSRRVEKEIESM